MSETQRHHRVVLGRLIESNAEDIACRWLERVRRDIARSEDVEITQLRNGMPDYLAELARLMSATSDTENGRESWAHIAREHGVTRVRVGFDIEQLTREFMTLRNVIEEAARAAGALTAPAATRLADLIEAGIAKSVQAYVETRDYEARRRQAEGIGALVHELRNPLSVAVAAEAIVREQAVPEQVRATDMLARGHRRLNELIDGVLLIEQLEAGKLQPRMGETRVGDLVERATAASRQIAASKCLWFRVDCDPQSTMTLDPELTTSALQNLVDNAVKYTDQGGVEVSVAEDDTSWSVHVRDTGPGLSPAELSAVFEPFHRGSTRKQGTGLGLAIARRAIEAQGGALGAESPGQVGCHFWFTLPRPAHEHGFTCEEAH